LNKAGIEVPDLPKRTVAIPWQEAQLLRELGCFAPCLGMLWDVPVLLSLACCCKELLFPHFSVMLLFRMSDLWLVALERIR